MIKGLFIAYYFPPVNSIATHRLYSFVKYLNNGEMGLDVICPAWEGDLKLESPKCKITYVGKRKFDGNYGQIELKGFSALKNIIFNRIGKLNYFRSSRPGKFYDEVIEALKTIDLNQYDFVLTSYGPLDAIYIGNYIKSKNEKIKWIIDYRDTYSLMEYYHFGIFKPYFKNLEKRLTKSADSFVTVSQTLKTQQQKLLSKPGECIYNGYELESKIGLATFMELKEPSMPIISYTGTLYEGERDVYPFLDYFKRNRLDERFSLVFALINDFDEQYLLKAFKKFNLHNVKIERNLTFSQTKSLQQSSTYLLLLAGFDGKANGYLTGKVFEYFEVKKPIIYSGTKSVSYELYKLIKDCHMGDHFEDFNYLNQEVYTKLGVDQFTRENQAKRLEEFIKSRVN